MQTAGQVHGGIGDAPLPIRRKASGNHAAGMRIQEEPEVLLVARQRDNAQEEARGVEFDAREQLRARRATGAVLQRLKHLHDAGCLGHVNLGQVQSAVMCVP